MKWYGNFFLLCLGFHVACQAFSPLLTGAYSVDPNTGEVLESWGDKMYYVGQAVGIACYLELARKMFSQYKEQMFAVYLIADLGSALGFGNLVDELFFRPYDVEAAEYFGLAVGLGIVTYKIIQRKRRPYGRDKKPVIGPDKAR